MQIKRFVWDLVNANSFLIMEGDNGLLVDVVDNQKLFESIEATKTLTVILTHSHFDHIIGLNRIRELKPDAKVIATKLCSENIGNIYRNMSSTAMTFIAFYEQGSKKDTVIEPFSCTSADQTFEEGIEFSWYGHHISLCAFHGHSNDSLIAMLDGRYMFSGDTLLPIPTVTRFPGGSTKRFWEEDMPRLRKMRGVEIVFPGHGEKGKLEGMLSVNKVPKR